MKPKGWKNESHRHSMSAKGVKSKPNNLTARGISDEQQEIFIKMAEAESRIEIALKGNFDTGILLHQASVDLDNLSMNKNLTTDQRRSLEKMSKDLEKFGGSTGEDWQKIHNLREAFKEMKRQQLKVI